MNRIHSEDPQPPYFAVEKEVVVLIKTLLGVAFLLVPAVVVKADVPSTKLVTALIQQESRGKDHAVGDKKLRFPAYGCLQIRQPCCDDVNRRHGTKIQAKDLLGNRKLSVWVCAQYIDMYATQKRLRHKPTAEDMARIWNGGPNGWKRKSTRKYWRGVQRFLK